MILHILHKDIRRLWLAIAASLVVLASLAWHDRWRSDWLPGATEGYLNILTPIVWACLIGLATAQEPLVGDRQFWITRPYRRPQLLTAKLLFAILFVHFPSILADCYILSSRGFPPLAYVPQLAMKQLVLAGAVTLPAMALAAVARSFSHFILEIVGVAAVFLVLSGSYWGFNYTWEPFDAVRRQLIVLLAAAASAAILGMQYFGRRVLVSRIVGLGAAVAAVVVFCYFLPQSALALRAGVAPAPAVPSLRFDTAPRSPYPSWGRDIMVALPIVVDGFPDPVRARVEAVHSEILTGAGEHYSQEMPTTYRPFEKMPYTLWIQPGDWDEKAPRWMTLHIDLVTFAKMQNAPVTLRGEAGVTLYRLLDSGWIGVGEMRDVDGLGRCTAGIAEERFAEERLKLECESPRDNPIGTRARLWSPATGREWKHRLGEARSIGNGPRVTWLSPIERDQTFWNIVPEPGGPGSQWQLPRDLAPGARIEITPQRVLGYAAVRYEFRDVDLRRYTVRAPTTPAAAR